MLEFAPSGLGGRRFFVNRDGEVVARSLSAPDSVSREPQTVYALRIGKHRDGSRMGVFAYAQEHARECRRRSSRWRRLSVCCTTTPATGRRSGS